MLIKYKHVVPFGFGVVVSSPMNLLSCVLFVSGRYVVFVVLVSYVHNRIYLLGGWVVYVYRSWNVW